MWLTLKLDIHWEQNLEGESIGSWIFALGFTVCVLHAFLTFAFLLSKKSIILVVQLFNSIVFFCIKI